MWTSISNGLLQGVANISINYATQELGLNPLLANIGFSAIAGAINAGIQASIGHDTDIFASLFETYKQSALVFFGAGDVWQQTAYIAQILDFSNIIKERGLVEALNIYATSFFNAVTTNAIAQSGKTIGKYIKDKLDAHEYTLRTMADGKVLRAVAIRDGQGNIVGNALFEEKPNGSVSFWDMSGFEQFGDNSTLLGWGELGVDTFGELGYKDADLYKIFDSDVQFQRILNGQQAYAEVKDSAGNTLLIIEPTESGHYNIYNSYGEYVDAKIKQLGNAEFSFSMKDGFGAYTGILFKDTLDEGSIAILKNLGFSDAEIDNMSLDINRDSNGNMSFKVNLPDGSTLNNVPSALSDIFANSVALFLGMDTKTSQQLPDYIKIPMKGFSMLKYVYTPSLATAACGGLNFFDLGIEVANKFSGPLKELLVFGCDYAKAEINSKLDVIKSGQTTFQEKLEAADDLFKMGDPLGDAIEQRAEDLSADKTVLDRALTGIERVLSFFIDAFRDTDTYKTSREQMDTKQRLLLDISMYMYDKEHDEDDYLQHYLDIHNMWDDLLVGQPQ